MKIDNNNAFTVKYFLEELSNFRQLCGNKDFMEDEEKQDIAIKAITFVYCNVYNDDGTTLDKDMEQKVQFWFKNAINNYDTRKTMLLTMKLRQLV